MYINDVIRLVKNYYPSEYSDEEMYIWCNEVSSMLAVEDRNVFREVYLKPNKKGYILLPEGVDIENIESVTQGGTILEKQDLRYFGRKLYCGASGGAIVKIVYLEPYHPIRLTKYRGEIYVNDAGDMLSLDACEFLFGDSINIRVPGANEISIENVPILNISYKSGKYIITTAPQLLTGIAGRSKEVSITRVVCDKTICAAPYDSMYVDYILAKINLYQRDTEAYNQHMTAFNSRLSAYKRWLINHMPPAESRFKNWW